MKLLLMLALLSALMQRPSMAQSELAESLSPVPLPPKTEETPVSTWHRIGVVVVGTIVLARIVVAPLGLTLGRAAVPMAGRGGCLAMDRFLAAARSF